MSDKSDDLSKVVRAIVEWVKEIIEERVPLLHQQLILTFGTLGAITFAALVFILEDPLPFSVRRIAFLTPHQNFVILILVLSIVSILALLSCLATSFAAAKISPPLGSIAIFGFLSGTISLFGFIVALIMIVGDFSPLGEVILVAVTLIALTFFALAIYYDWPKPK